MYYCYICNIYDVIVVVYNVFGIWILWGYTLGELEDRLQETLKEFKLYLISMLIREIYGLSKLKQKLVNNREKIKLL